MTIESTQSFLSDKPCYYWNRQRVITYQYELNLEFISLIMGEDNVLLREVGHLCIDGIWEKSQIA
jgi:hypothetical protein